MAKRGKLLGSSRDIERIGLWVTIAALAIGGVGAYVQFQTMTLAFIQEARPWHSNVGERLDHLLNVEIKELAEENDTQQVEITTLQERQNQIYKLVDELHKRSEAACLVGP